MDTINLIDKYKLFILEDELDTAIVVLMYYHGYITDNDIVSFLNIKKSDLQQHLLNLYTHNYIRKEDSNGWKCSEKTVSLLEQLEFGDYLASLMLDDLHLDDRDKIFLLAILKTSYKQSLSVPFVVLLRAAKFILFECKDYKTEDRDFIKISIYTLIMGASTSSAKLNSDVFIDTIFHWHNVHELPFWKKNKYTLNSNAKYYSDICAKSVSHNGNITNHLWNNIEFDNDIEHFAFTTRHACLLFDNIADQEISDYINIKDNAWNTLKFLIFHPAFLLNNVYKNKVDVFEENIKIKGFDLFGKIFNSIWKNIEIKLLSKPDEKSSRETNES